MLWVDKHRPHTFDKFVVHADIAAHLQKLVEAGECPHLLFYGPSGAGKRTLVSALLRQLYGPGAERLRVESKPWKIELPDKRNIEVDLTTVGSAHHLELNPADAGFQDRYVVQEVIKDMARSKPLDARNNSNLPNFKVLVLSGVDALSREAQHALRRTMEKYSAACRLILLCDSLSRVIEALRSRCLAVRVSAPTNAEVVQVLETVASKEKLRLPRQLALRVADYSKRNMRRALLALEACKVANYPFQENQPVQATDWELFVTDIASDILSEQSPKRLLGVRQMLYELLVNCIPPEIILKTLALELMKKLDAELKNEVIHWAAYYEHRLQCGQKAIFHLEAFVAKFMAIYKRFLIDTFG
eukprot:jgi/Chlat1/7558/Chrsp63S07060